MSFSESLSLSENFTYETGLTEARPVPGLATRLIGVGILISFVDLANYTLFFRLRFVLLLPDFHVYKP